MGDWVWKVNTIRRKLIGRWYWRLILFIFQNGLVGFFVNRYSASSAKFIPTSLSEFSQAFDTPGFVGMWVSLIVVGFMISWLPIDDDPLVAAVVDGGAEKLRELARNAQSPEEVMKMLKTVKKGGGK